MSYNEPPEWQGRGPRSREGWPNETYSPGAPRSHRRVGEEQTEFRRDDTGEFRPSRAAYADEMPTDPAIRYRPGGPVKVPGEQTRRELVVPAQPEPARAEHIIVPIDRRRDSLEGAYLWLGVACRILGCIALLAALWVLGMVIADKGVPLWVPRS